MGRLVLLSVFPMHRSLLVLRLTERQLQILIGIAAGKTNMAIAKELILSESAIKQETVKIFRSLGVENRRQAAQKAIAMGLVPEGLSQDRI